MVAGEIKLYNCPVVLLGLLPTLSCFSRAQNSIYTISSSTYIITGYLDSLCQFPHYIQLSGAKLSLFKLYLLWN